MCGTTRSSRWGTQTPESSREFPVLCSSRNCSSRETDGRATARSGNSHTLIAGCMLTTALWFCLVSLPEDHIVFKGPNPFLLINGSAVDSHFDGRRSYLTSRPTVWNGQLPCIYLLLHFEMSEKTEDIRTVARDTCTRTKWKVAHLFNNNKLQKISS